MIKYKIGVLFLFVMSLLWLSFIQANGIDNLLLGKIIYIDPGHGGLDPGAVYKDLKESNINLDISLRLKDKLEKYGATVYLTRYGDYDLARINTSQRKRSDLLNRSKIINKSNCDMYVSVHLNADPSTIWYGAQVFFDGKNPENEKIASMLQKELKKHSNTKRNYSEIKDMYMYQRIERPGALIELGFITNPNDRYKLKQAWYKDKLVTIISNAMIKYFNP